MVKKKHALALFPLALCFSSAPILAATTADLEKRLQDQEKKILRLENQLRGTRSAVKENRGRIADMNERLKINGFFSGGVAVMDGASDMSYGDLGIDDNYSTAAVSKLGIQMTFAVADNMDLTGQLVSKGSQDYNIESEWAYLSYRPTSDLTLRVGRQRIPYYLLSEYLDVGYAYPWVRPPIELYNIPISSTDGLGLLYDMFVGDVKLSVQAYAGAASDRSEALDGQFELNQAWGTALFAEYGDFTFRLGYNRSHLDIADRDAGGVGDNLITGIQGTIDLNNALANPQLAPFGAQSIEQTIDPVAEGNYKSYYQSAGMMYDNGELLVIAELAKLEVEDFTFPGTESGYITVGYRFGQWTPHVTFAKYYTHADSDDYIRKNTDFIESVTQNAAFTAGNMTGTIGALTAACSTDCTTLQLATLQTLSSTQSDLLSATTSLNGLSSALQQFVQSQQSYTLGLVYDVNPRVKAKAEVAFYEGFGSNTTAVFDGSSFTSVEVDGNGRFSVDEPGSGDKHTAIYSLSIDAVF